MQGWYNKRAYYLDYIMCERDFLKHPILFNLNSRLEGQLF
jgi:hypothetical protein